MYACVCVCVCVCACVRACVRACVCVSQWKKVPDEWQARQTTPAIFHVSSSMHNAKKITTRARGPFHLSITAILRAWRLFYMFLVQFFLKINAGARKKQINLQKINTLLHRGNAKCDGQEAFARGTINDTIDEKQLVSNRPPSCSAAKKKQWTSTWADLSCRFFEIALSFSLQTVALSTHWPT